jgi:flagellar biosynthesis component FlhA
VRHANVRKLVFLSGVATLVALAMMVLSIVSPKPIYLVLAMSVGQGVGTLSLALDLQGGTPAAYEQAAETRAESVNEDQEPPTATP